MAATIPEENKVTYQFLGRSGLKVSNIALGCLSFGKCVHVDIPNLSDEDLSHKIINRFVEWGGNFLDTGNVYGFGESERIVGRWLETQPRDKFVIATKCRMNMGTQQNANNVGLSRRHLTDSIDKSLQRLHTDFVDLYQTHLMDNATPLEETLRTLDDLVRIGKIRYIGVSNVTGWQLQKMVDTTKKLGLNQIISLQQLYNLINRQSELEPFQVCKAEGLGVLPWSPLLSGVLAGQVKRGVTPKEGRPAWLAQKLPGLADFSDRAFDIIDAVDDIAKKRGRSMPQVALRWLLQRDVVPSVIIGVETVEQLDDNMGAANGWSLTKEEMQRLDDISSPTLLYPYEGVFRSNKDRQNPSIGNFYVNFEA